MSVKKNISSTDDKILQYSDLKVIDSIIVLKFNSPIEDVHENTRSSELIIQKINEILAKNPNKKFNWLIDLTTVGKMKNMPSQSRKNYAELAKNKRIKKVAVAGGDVVVKTITNFIVNLTGRKNSFKWFDDAKSALAWLKK